MDTRITEAGHTDMPRLDAALRALAKDLGDPYHGSVEGLTRACHGASAFAGAVLAERDGAVIGAALFTALYSTTMGGPGVRVSDLWVAEAGRGAGVGRRLLSAAAQAGARRWGAGFLMVPVYADNGAALRFYERLGFTVAGRDRTALLARDAFAHLAGEPA